MFRILYFLCISYNIKSRLLIMTQIFPRQTCAHLSILIPHPVPQATWVVTVMNSLQFLCFSILSCASVTEAFCSPNKDTAFFMTPGKRGPFFSPIFPQQPVLCYGTLSHCSVSFCLLASLLHQTLKNRGFLMSSLCSTLHSTT